MVKITQHRVLDWKFSYGLKESGCDNLKYLNAGNEENEENFIHYIWWPNLNPNRLSAQYKLQVLTTYLSRYENREEGSP
jgi:hypothetical protein